MNIVFFTGAGMSQESGLLTFRGENGVWDTIDAEAVASAKNWYSSRRHNCKELRQRMLDFFNPIRREIMAKAPNDGHRIIANLEQRYKVTVITQNGDDFHERAGSSDVIHLHGEALKNSSTVHRYDAFDIDRNNPDIHIGDKAADGSQVRPYVIFFDENLEIAIWKRAVKATEEADLFVIVGCSLVVHPAIELLEMINKRCKVVVINPDDSVELPKIGGFAPIFIKQKASIGLEELVKQLNL
jgi:NAD-dependent deacetylase